ncbi:hypothetical protein BDA99DRAFT_566521 [Phascolomyces articulosus]|uniref:F-box domain-containing protein n=1 Tax=Phascolomyces articulosus TaxID=60185 RepID=A0AAD5P6U4_9FUNG|nr:hypothetical protein BDA99DRAFT_566521 [Phascolomyces articulosus]
MTDSQDTSVDGYLGLGKIYEQQKNLELALGVYKQGLDSVKQDNPQRVHLEKAKKTVSATLYRNSQRWLKNPPNEILPSILIHLDIIDMLHCTGVCESWREFILDWQVFLDRIKKEMSGAHLIVSDLRDRHNEDTLLLSGLYFDNKATHDSLLFILHTTTEKTKMKSLVIKAMTPQLEQVKFNNFPSINKKQINIPEAVFLSLTFLQLCFEEGMEGFVNTNDLCGIIYQSPNLCHLFLDSRGSIYHGCCMNIAISHCPRLETLAITREAQMAETVYEDAYHDQIHRNMDTLSNLPLSTTKNHLKRFIYSGAPPYSSTKNDFKQVVKEGITSLHILYLYYDGLLVNHKLLKDIIFRSGQFYTFLKELVISNEDYFYGAHLDKVATGFKDVFLNHVLPAIPMVEALTIDDHVFSHNHSTIIFFRMDHEILEAIANFCPRLKTLKIIGQRSHSMNGLYYLATASHGPRGPPRLEYLEMDMDPRMALKLIEWMPSLIYLYIRCDKLRSNPDPVNLEFYRAKDLLESEERGGKLIYPYTNIPKLVQQA